MLCSDYIFPTSYCNFKMANASSSSVISWLWGVPLFISLSIFSPGKGPNAFCPKVVGNHWRNFLPSLSDNFRGLPLFFFHSFKVIHQRLFHIPVDGGSFWDSEYFPNDPCPPSILIHIVPIYWDIQENSW